MLFAFQGRNACMRGCLHIKQWKGQPADFFQKPFLSTPMQPLSIETLDGPESNAVYSQSNEIDGLQRGKRGEDRAELLQPSPRPLPVVRRSFSCFSHTNLIIAMSFLANVICYADRTNLSVAIIVIAESSGWGDGQKGTILAAFFYGYPFPGLFAGLASGRWGGGRVLLWAVLGWSLLTMLTPSAAKAGLGPLIVCRVAMGLTEGMASPCIHAWIAAQIPQEDRTRAITWATSGQHIGTCLAMLCAPLVAYSWPLVFYIFGTCGFIWAAMACVLIPKQAQGNTVPTALATDQVEAVPATEPFFDLNSPSSVRIHTPAIGTKAQSSVVVPDTVDSSGFLTPVRRSPTGDEVDSVSVSELQLTGPAGPTLRQILLSWPFLGVVITHFCHNYGFYLFVSWLPEYFNSLGVKLDELGLLTVMPFLCMFGVDIGWGHIANKLIESGQLSRLHTRWLSQAIGFIFPIIALLLVTFGKLYSPAALAMGILSIGLGLNAASHAGYWAILIDLSSEHAGTLCGVSNSISALPGVIGNSATGYILGATGSWTIVFGIVEVMYVIGLFAFIGLARDKLKR